MTSLISAYKKSGSMVKHRIGELLAQRNELKASGKQNDIEELDLDRRIRLLYVEYRQTREIVNHLTQYQMRVGTRRQFLENNRPV